MAQESKTPAPFRTSIGGQALIEGILMRGVDRQAIVCRKSDGTLVSRVDPLKLSKDKHPWMGYPFIRGVVNFLDSMVNGVKAITWSAEQQPEDEQGEPDKFDLWIQKHFSDETAEKIILYTAVVLGIALSVGLFALLPTFLAGLLNRLVPLGVWRGLAEGIFRLAIFLGYLKLCSMIPDMKRVALQHARRETAAAEIFLHEADGVPGAVHKQTIRRAAGERFDAELTRSGEQIEDFAPLHIKLDDIEHGLLHLIGRGADIPPHRLEQTAAAACAGDHSHGVSSSVL